MGDVGLIAILLITRSRPGPELVYHYPTQPQLPQSRGTIKKSRLEDATTASEPDTDDEEQTHPDGEAERNRTASSSVITHSARMGRAASSKCLFGYSHDSLAKLLSPGRWCNRKKFEIRLTRLTFVGHPVFAREDDSWSKKPAKSPQPRPPSTYDAGYDYYGIEQLSNAIVTQPELGVMKAAHDAASFETNPVISGGTSVNSGDTGAVAMMEQLTMFNVVFVFSETVCELGVANNLTAMLYDRVVMPLAEALRYCQKHSTYVARETRRMQTMQGQIKTSSPIRPHSQAHLIENSELAWSLKEIYARISRNEVARIRLSGHELSVSLSQSSQTPTDDTIALDLHSGLLLLEEKDVLLRQLHDASALAYFIREHLHTKSLDKLSSSTGVPAEDLVYLAQHLVRWRKAKPIRPLHARNTYVLSHDAPYEDFEMHSTEYSRCFPALPSLSRMLKVLGGSPMQYWAFIPSKDHRPLFMDSLAWLVRKGFVTQLITVGWLRLPSHDTESEHASRASAAHHHTLDDETGSVSSERTAIPTLHSDGSTPSIVIGKQHAGLRSAPLTSGKSASSESLSWPRHINIHLQNLQKVLPDAELSEFLPSLIQYLDGRHALEDIAAKESIKRAKLDAWLDTLEKIGGLVRAKRLAK